MREIVLDLETEKEFREVGGKENMHLLGVSVVGVYRYDKDLFYAYEKDEFTALESILEACELLIGFNINHFDLPVLQPHVTLRLERVPVLDLMSDIEKFLGFRVSLDNLSRATINASKSGIGLEALSWWRAGEKQKVKEYCLQDVRLTRDLYEFGKREGFIFGDTRDRGRVKIPVTWGSTLFSPKKILGDGLEKRRAVEIEYAADPKFPPERRLVEVHKIAGDTFLAFCHLRQAPRTFQIDRVMRATLTNETYQLHQDVQRSLI